MSRRRLVIFSFLLLAAVLVFSSSLFAQGCAMCYTSIANSNLSQQAKHTLNAAILVLLVPAASLFVGIFALAYRYRNSFNVAPSESSESYDFGTDLAA